MDVKYIPSDWEKMKDGIGDLIGLGRWGKGMIDELKDLSDILEDAESDIAKYDVDGAIAFQNTSQKSKYQGLFEDFDILHNFSGKVGDIVDRTIDQPFYEDMDAFVQSMRDVSISNYTTTNRIGATEIVQSYAGYGVPQQFEIDKAEVSLDDLLSGDTFYGEQMKLEYEVWKELNPDQDFSQMEYQQAVVNTRAFEYESIRNTQENKEFWFQIGALAVIVGATLIFPPAGIALGAAYGAYELSSAISGKDLVSGRELDTSERWVRGLIAPLDIVPGVSGLTKFGSAARLAHVGDNIGQMGLKSSVKGSTQQGLTHVNNVVTAAGSFGATRLRSAGAAIQNGANVVKNKVIKDAIEVGRLADQVITQAKNFPTSQQMGLALEGNGSVRRIHHALENTNPIENQIKNVLSKIDEVNINSGTRGVSDALEGKFGFAFTSDMKGFSEQLPKELEKHHITLERFHELRLKPYSDLTDEEVKIIKDIRDAVPFITKDTLLQKTLPIQDVDKYLSGQYTEIGGYVAKVEDVADVRMYEDVVETSRLDYTTRDGSRPYPEGGNSYAMIRFKTSKVEEIDLPYAERFGGTNTDGPPCTLNGFTGARNGRIVPEWTFNGYYKPQNGAELYKVINGEEILIGNYKNGRFIEVNHY